MEQNEKYDPDESIGYLMGIADRYLRQGLREKFKKGRYNITGEHWHVLMYLYLNEGPKQKELALLTGKSKEAIARVLNYLEEHSFVVRVPAEDDSRSKRIFLTTKGKDYEKKLGVLAKENLTVAEKGLKPQELKIFKKCLRQVVKNVTS